MTGRQRAAAFLRETHRHRVDRVGTFPWGELLVTPSLPRVHGENIALVDRWDGGAVDLHRELDRIQGEHDFGHRKGRQAQIEDVATLPVYRSRGLSRAVVLHAVVEARRSGAELIFLVADESDWPKELYGRLGYDAIGAEHVAGRSAAGDS